MAPENGTIGVADERGDLAEALADMGLPVGRLTAPATSGGRRPT